MSDSPSEIKCKITKKRLYIGMEQCEIKRIMLYNIRL